MFDLSIRGSRPNSKYSTALLLCKCWLDYPYQDMFGMVGEQYFMLKKGLHFAGFELGPCKFQGLGVNLSDGLPSL